MNKKIGKLDRRYLLKLINVRRATASDAVAFLRLEAECFEMRYLDTSLYYWRPIIDYCYAWKAVCREKIIGGIIAIPTRNGQIYINSLFVQKDFRKLGIATNLLNRILSISSKDGFILDVKPEKEYLVAFYKKYGFRIVRRERNYYLDGTPRVIMRRFTKSSRAKSASLDPTS